MIKISELKEGDVLKVGSATALTVLHNLGKVVIVERNSGITSIYSEKELNRHGYKLVPPNTEKKYFMGFEVREYPERPIVEVSDNGRDKHFMRLIEVHTDHVTCIDSENFPSHWGYIYRIPETMIIEPSSVTREGDGC